MSDGDLDARLRRALAGVDTSPDFESRLAARIAALPGVPEEILRVRIERRRQVLRGRLRREALLNALTAAGVGAALIALVWREGPAVARWVQGGVAVASDPGALTGLAFLAVGLGAWITLQRLSPR
jgi:hypothetical protein